MIRLIVWGLFFQCMVSMLIYHVASNVTPTHTCTQGDDVGVLHGGDQLCTTVGLPGNCRPMVNYIRSHACTRMEIREIHRHLPAHIFGSSEMNLSTL